MASMGNTIPIEVQRAASVLRSAKAMFITAGAGMGVDSGLPDFRGLEGFWKAYPPLEKLRIRLPAMSNPSWFVSDPRFAWGFFGHRYNLYSRMTPHRGFGTLLRWSRALGNEVFVFTSNVDGHFQSAGFDSQRIVECHGTIHYHQCTDPDLDDSIWPVAPGTAYDVDMETLHLRGPLPIGPPGKNDQVARPNILMFGDSSWISNRTSNQEKRFEEFRNGILAKNVPSVVIEIGAGHAVPTVRRMSEEIASSCGSTLIRINPLEPEVPSSSHISIRMKGLEALDRLDEALLNGQHHHG